MTILRRKLINEVINEAISSINYNIHNDFHKQNGFIQQKIITNNLLTDDEKAEAKKILNKDYDREKVFHNEGTRRICKNCKRECLATLYCEYCVRDYLKANFSNWTSGNNDIDNLIQKCQLETLGPDNIIEWIPYRNLKNIKYLTKGGFSEIYTAVWNNGCYYKWDDESLKRSELPLEIILKNLGNIESANKRWFEEVCNLIQLTLNNF
jgi:hypothetical protein